MLVPRSGQIKRKHYYNLYAYQITNSMHCGMAVAIRKGGDSRLSRRLPG